jgi:RNA polymerase sigma-70 factor (ECF subfamily)
MQRRAGARPALTERDEVPVEAPAVDPLEQAVLRWQVASALARLRPEHRELIRLAHWNGLTMREIADLKGIPLGTVKSRTSYALRSLRLVLDEMGVES